MGREDSCSRASTMLQYAALLHTVATPGPRSKPLETQHLPGANKRVSVEQLWRQAVYTSFC